MELLNSIKPASIFQIPRCIPGPVAERQFGDDEKAHSSFENIRLEEHRKPQDRILKSVFNQEYFTTMLCLERSKKQEDGGDDNAMLMFKRRKRDHDLFISLTITCPGGEVGRSTTNYRRDIALIILVLSGGLRECQRAICPGLPRNPFMLLKRLSITLKISVSSRTLSSVIPCQDGLSKGKPFVEQFWWVTVIN